MPEASLALKFTENMSEGLASLRNNMTPFRNDLTALERELSVLRDTKVDLNVDMTRAKRELDAAKRAFRALDDEAADDTALREAQGKYEALAEQLRAVSKAANQTERDMLSAAEVGSKTDNRAASRFGGGGSEMLGGLGQAGLYQMTGQALSGAANTLVGSAFGDEMGVLFSSALSGVGSGAAIGSMIAPGIGTAIGAAVGGVTGLVTGATQIFEKRDDAFKGYVQANTEGQLTARATDIQSGSAIAGQREQDAIAFNTLLGDGVGDQYLTDLRAMAAKTPMEYGDLTGMSRSLATGFKDDPSRMLALMGSIGDAGAAVGVDVQGMDMMATAMSRMQSSGKVTMEYLNLIQERGVDAVDMLSGGLGKTKGEIYDMISKGKVDGVEAVRIIQDAMDALYGGAMDRQSETFGGLSSTLADAQKEMQNAYGEGYNEVRGKGIKAETDYLSGESGTAMQEANKAIGAWQASQENSKEALVRAAQDAVLDSDDYKKAMAAGTDAGYAEAGRMLMEAKVKGQNEYNASEGATLARESELALAAGIRDDTSSNKAYWDAGYAKGEQYSSGLAEALVTNGMASMAYQQNPDGGFSYGGFTYDAGGKMILTSHAAGLERVPYDNYPALLHKDERVQTAAQARSDNGEGGVRITISGNDFHVRQESDIAAIATALADEIRLRKLAGVNA